MKQKKSKIKKNTATETIDNLKESISWLNKNINTNISSNRISDYERYLSNIESISTENEKEKYRKTMQEIHSFLKIYNSLKDIDNKSIYKKIQTIVSGPINTDSRSNKKPDHSRNYLYELTIASRLIESGLNIDVSGDCDIVSYAFGKKVFIECKRITSEKQIMKRAKRAAEQVEERAGPKKPNDKKAQYIFLDLSVILSQNQERKTFKSEKEIEIYSKYLLDSILNKKKKQIIERVRDQVSGIVITGNILGVLKSDNEKDIIHESNIIIMLDCSGHQGPEDYKYNNAFITKISINENQHMAYSNISKLPILHNKKLPIMSFLSKP